jgi:dethiobiotin synthetase
MASGLFVTGTDTGVGKTIVSCALLRLFAREGLRAVGFKPVAAGAAATPDGLRNEDAVRLREASGIDVPYERVNPVTLGPAIAPHIAAGRVGLAIDIASLASDHERLCEMGDLVVTEGAGGWLVPTGGDATLADLAVAIGHPVVLVVGMRLGCINHALLSAEAIRARGLPLAGWIDNRIDPSMSVQEDNVTALETRLGAPRLGSVPWLGETPFSRAIGLASEAMDRNLVLAAITST